MVTTSAEVISCPRIDDLAHASHVQIATDFGPRGEIQSLNEREVALNNIVWCTPVTLGMIRST